jgi:hypothetical protein
MNDSYISSAKAGSPTLNSKNNSYRKNNNKKSLSERRNMNLKQVKAKSPIELKIHSPKLKTNDMKLGNRLKNLSNRFGMETSG